MANLRSRTAYLSRRGAIRRSVVRSKGAGQTDPAVAERAHHGALHDDFQQMFWKLPAVSYGEKSRHRAGSGRGDAADRAAGTVGQPDPRGQPTRQRVVANLQPATAPSCTVE